MDLRKRIDDFKFEVSNEVSEYVISQKDDWQKVPWLALQADGRGGYSSRLAMAYREGLWNVDDSVFVDLESGNLVGIPYGSFSLPEDFEELRSDTIFRAVQYSTDDVNAKKVIESLEGDLLREDNKYCGDGGFKTNAEWRESFMRLGFTPDKYVRI
jgi:hypothetical protein